MWQTNGIALDSSWRHKNEHVAPLTFLVTLDSHMKMIPGEYIQLDLGILIQRSFNFSFSNDLIKHTRKNLN